MKLAEKDEVLQDDDLIAKELNKFFKNAVSTLNIIENSFINNRKSEDITDPVDKAIKKYKLLDTKTSKKPRHFFHSK